MPGAYPIGVQACRFTAPRLTAGVIGGSAGQVYVNVAITPLDQQSGPFAFEATSTGEEVLSLSVGDALVWSGKIRGRKSHSAGETVVVIVLERSGTVPARLYVSDFALRWRQAFFDDIAGRFARGEPAEDIDVTHRKLLKQLLEIDRWKGWSEDDLDRCVRAWHSQQAWPDVRVALPLLRKEFDVCVLANGTSRLQIDITKSAKIDFDLLLSSELLTLTKPDPEIYRKAMRLLRREPEECVMVAAHAYDLRAAKKVGMRRIYIESWTEDPKEDMGAVRKENDYFINALKDGG